MSVHTNGPWFSDGASVWRRDPKELYENGGDVAGDKPLATAHRGFHHEGAQGYPVEANARLIAAAPDLLAALQALFFDYKQLADSGDAGNWSLETTPVGKEAIAALIKATGAVP